MQADANQNAQGDKSKRIVKRYSNRKLYDTRESRYVTLLQIAEMVRTGEEVQIIDNATKEDLTEVTLAQIIYEEQKHHSRSVPLATLRDLIHQRGERLISQLREGPLGRLIPEEKAEGAAVEAPAAKEVVAPVKVEESQTYGGAPAKDGAEKKTLIDQSREAIETLQARIDDSVKSVLSSFSPFQQLQAEVVRLTARIDELEARLKKEESAKPAKGRRE